MNEEEEIRELPQQLNMHQIYNVRLWKSAPARHGRVHLNPPQKQGGGPGSAADVTPCRWCLVNYSLSAGKYQGVTLINVDI